MRFLSSLVWCVLCLVLPLAVSCQSASPSISGTLYYSSSFSGSDRIQLPSPASPRPPFKFVWNVTDSQNGDAFGVYQPLEMDAQHGQGWNILDIETRVKSANKHESTASAITDSDLFFAAGFIEGALSWRAIADGWPNFMTEFFGSTNVPSQITDFVQENDAWMRKQIATSKHDTTNTNTNSSQQYFQRVELILSQLEGLAAGYAYAAPASAVPMPYWNMVMLNLDGDLEDLQPALDPSARHQKLTRMASSTHPALRGLTHCSALIKFIQSSSSTNTNNPSANNELYMSHNTFDVYPSMTRIYKHYTLNTPQSGTLSISFSSSPAFLSSVDDFYITQSQNHVLGVTETTNSIYNSTLWTEIRSNTVMSYIRAMIANYFAQSPQQWTELFVQYNSGTYNNQWMIVDFTAFEISKRDAIRTSSPQILPNGLFWMVETLPNMYIAADMTSILQQNTYWASYNIPYFSEIYNVSGTRDEYNLSGDLYSWSQCPRANIFRREQSSIVDLATDTTVMTWNKWQTDPYSLGDPCNAPMARCDLSTLAPQAFGGIDSKITNSQMAFQRVAMAMNGPTHADQKPFDWRQNNGLFESQPHYGQPNVFDFPHIQMQPKQF